MVIQHALTQRISESTAITELSNHMTEMNQVLVVEDELVIRTALKRLLERQEYKVSEAGTVKESIDNFDMDDFDVIISDLRLPGAP